MENINTHKRILGDVKCGEIVTIAEREYIVLDQANGSTSVITKNSVKNMAFGESGNYVQSDIRKYCIGEFYDELSRAIGDENIFTQIVNLGADDGTGKDISVTDKVSILTTEEYRFYREYLPVYNDRWWTATRVSADLPGYNCRVCCVDSGGVLSWNDCDCSCGVRPFCVLNSLIIVS